MARGRAYSLDFRIAMMKQHAQGRSFSTLSRETDVPRDVLRRWWQRYRCGGEPALRPRSRRPRRSPTQVPAATEAAILALRTQGLGPARIALQVAPSVSTNERARSTAVSADPASSTGTWDRATAATAASVRAPPSSTTAASLRAAILSSAHAPARADRRCRSSSTVRPRPPGARGPRRR